MAPPKQLPQRPRPKPQLCPRSATRQHRFYGYPRGAQRCIHCNLTREQAEKEAEG